MQISNHVYAKKMNFLGGNLMRTVFVYLVSGEKGSVLIDTGVFPNRSDVTDFISDCGQQPKNIIKILITHAHTDHIGSLKFQKEVLDVPAASSAWSARWIEDVELQKAERPVPNFDAFVGGSTMIEQKLSDGDIIELGDSCLKVYATPGHEPGHLAFFHPQDGVLITGDAIPVPGEMPVYHDVSAEMNTLKKLQQINHVNVLLMSWADPYIGSENAKKAICDGIDYVRHIHNLVNEGIQIYGENDSASISKYVHSALGLSPEVLNKLFTNTINAHIREKDLKIV